jgi:hypothetical protein
VRNFSIDAITKLEVMDADAKVVSTKTIDQALGSSYGIFNGAAQGWVKLKFTPKRARRVAGETWHPMQESSFEDDGRYVLSFSYADDHPLLQRIMHDPATRALLVAPLLVCTIDRHRKPTRWPPDCPYAAPDERRSGAGRTR